MDEVITQERAPNVVSELLVVIRNSETRREALARENMQLREDNRRLQSRVRQIRNHYERNPETREIRVMGHSPPRRHAIHPVSPL